MNQTATLVSLANASLNAVAEYVAAVNALPDSTVTPDEKTYAALRQISGRHRGGCDAMAAIPASSLEGWKAKARVLAAAEIRFRDGRDDIMDTGELAWSLARDIVAA